MRTYAALVFAFVVLAAAPWVALQRAEAYHYHTAGYGGDDSLHIRTLHWDSSSSPGPLDEDYCAWSDATAALSHTTLKNYLQGAWLYGGTTVWEGTGSNKIDLWGTANDCWGYSDNSWIDIFGFSFGSTTPYCGGTNYSCVNFGLAFYNPNTGGLEDYWQGYIYFKRDHLTGSQNNRRANANHEFGHIVSLMDPPFGGPCNWPFTPTIVSVMHQYTTPYGCSTQRLWPSSGDRSSVSGNVMPYPHITE